MSSTIIIHNQSLHLITSPINHRIHNQQSQIITILINHCKLQATITISHINHQPASSKINDQTYWLQHTIIIIHNNAQQIIQSHINIHNHSSQLMNTLKTKFIIHIHASRLIMCIVNHHHSQSIITFNHVNHTSSSSMFMHTN